MVFALIAALAAGPVAAQNVVGVSYLLGQIERQGRVVVAAQYGSQGWSVTSCPGRQTSCQIDRFDPQTLHVHDWMPENVGFLPPAGGLPASAIAATVEAGGRGTLSQMFFNDGKWTVWTVIAGGAYAQYALDPMTGAITACGGALCP